MGKTITKEEIALFPAEEYPGRILEISTLEEALNAVDYLSGFKMLGFDTETRPSFIKGNVNSVALIQLCTGNICFLFRLNIIGFPPPLIQLLSDAEVLKIGLSLKDDFHSMKRRMKFTPQGFLDIQNIINGYNISEMSLQKIYALLFNKKISKSQRLTNWEAERLTEPQKRYAALDAWACLKIYEELICPTQNYI